MKKTLMVGSVLLATKLLGMEGLKTILGTRIPNPHIYERVVISDAVRRDMAAKFSEQKEHQGHYAQMFDSGVQLPADEWEVVEEESPLNADPSEIDQVVGTIRHEPFDQQANTWVSLSKRQRVKDFGLFAESTDIQTALQTGGNIGFQEPVRNVYRFLPENSMLGTNSAGAKKRLVVFIHGTFSHHNEKFKTDQAPAFKAVLNYAELSTLALPEHPVVEVISWSWNGYNEHESRVQGGKNLAALLDAIYSNYSSIEIIAHSHGCNVVNIACRYIKNSFIHNAFYFACPVRGSKPNDEYQPTDRIKNLYNFYSAVDKIQWAGSWDDSVGWWGYATGFVDSTAWWRFDSTRTDVNVMNIDCRVNNQAPGHSSILGALGGLYHVVRWIGEKYAGCHEFILHSVLEPDGLVLEILVALHQDEKSAPAQAREYSQIALSLYKERSGLEMSYVAGLNRLLTLK